MRALLDTHAFIWATTDDPALSPSARELIRSIDNELLLSAASVYELAWKAAHGELTLPDDPSTWVHTRMQALQVRSLDVTAAHALRAAALPPIHGDPWDRILVAQAASEGIPLVTVDARIRRYDVATIW